jgi:YD repeat-containing protein
MRHAGPRFLLFWSIQLSIFNICQGQSRSPQNTLLPPPAGITIDGKLDDWGDSLRYLNADKHITYSLANDKDNLYMAIRINDYGEQVMVLNAGLTLSVDPRGRKKESFTVTFPVGQEGGPTNFGIPRKDNNSNQPEEEHDELVEAELTKLRHVKVTGFSDIEGTLITTSNTYGIKTALDYDKEGYLVCEAVIPLKFFHADNISKNEWAFNFRINGISRPGEQDHENGGQEGTGRGGRGGGFGGGGHGGRGGGRGGRSGGFGGGQTEQRGELAKSIDFWEKFYLAGQ